MIATEFQPKTRIDPQTLELTEKVVNIRRVAKVIKGGRHLSFSAMVVVGDGEGHVGAGLGKADAVPDAVRKGVAAAKKDLILIPLKGSTIRHQVVGKYGAAKVLLRPASPGTGVIAGGGVRATLEQAGIKDILTKSLGSPNPINVVKATLDALSQLRDVEAKKSPGMEPEGQGKEPQPGKAER